MCHYLKVSRLTKDIRSLKHTESETLEEQDIDLREVKEFSKSVDKMLLEIAAADPELSTVLQTYFEQVPFLAHLLFLIDTDLNLESCRRSQGTEWIPLPVSHQPPVLFRNWSRSP